jgi:hypothetical protein
MVECGTLSACTKFYAVRAQQRCSGVCVVLQILPWHGIRQGEDTAEVRKFRCPIKALMQGDANPKQRRTTSSSGTTEVRVQCRMTNSSGTTEVRAQAAHLDDEDGVCACCADQPPKRVLWPQATD